MTTSTQCATQVAESPLLSLIGVSASAAGVPVIERTMYQPSRQRLSRECYDRFGDALSASGSTSWNPSTQTEGDR